MHEPNKYYMLQASGDDSADLYIFGDIVAWAWPELGEQSGVTIVNQLKSLTAKNINVHINSYGGDVSEGLAIYNTLREHPAHVTTICDGFACSAASVVFMAGDDRIMSHASVLMIHNAWTMATGNAEDLRKTAEDLDVITQASVEAYKHVASISEEEIKALMDNETWISAQDAVTYGFATAIDEPEDSKQPRQSAFGLIREKLFAVESVLDAVYGYDFAESIAQKVMEKMAVKEHKKTPTPELTGWDKFFQKKEI